MMKPSLCGGALAAALLVSLPVAALAQSAAAPSTAKLMTAAPSTAAPADAEAQARVEARVKQLHTQLKITAAEEAQWKAFADVMISNAQEMDSAAAQRADQLSSMNALQDMQAYEQLAEQHVQHLQKLIPAFQALYNAMPDEQKKVADQVFRAGAERRAQARANPQ